MDFDLPLARSNMAAAHDGIPSGAERYDWAHNPRVVMGVNPTASGVPDWYSGTREETYPRIIPWLLVYRQAGKREPSNTRIELRNLTLWVRNRNWVWSLVNDNSIPAGGGFFNEVQTESIPWEFRTSDDGVSFRPPLGRCLHAWGVRSDINPFDVSGVFVSMEHRIVVDDHNKADTRASDCWLVEVGADYWPSQDASNPKNWAVMCGRFQRAIPEWRVVSALAE